MENIFKGGVWQDPGANTKNAPPHRGDTVEDRDVKHCLH